MDTDLCIDLLFLRSSVLYPRLAFRREFWSVLNRIIPNMTRDVGSRQNVGPPLLGKKEVKQGGEAHGAHRVKLCEQPQPRITREPRSIRGSAIWQVRKAFLFAAQDFLCQFFINEGVG
jgi:hypothetical protein